MRIGGQWQSNSYWDLTQQMLRHRDDHSSFSPVIYSLWWRVQIWGFQWWILAQCSLFCTSRFELNMLPSEERLRSDSAEVGTFLSMSTAEFVSYLWPPGLPEEDLDEESIFGIGWDHDLLDVRVGWALVAAERKRKNTWFSLQLGLQVIKRKLSRFFLTYRSWRGGCDVVHSPDGHVSVLGLAWLGTALQWCLGDGWHGLVHQHLLVLHFLTWAPHKTHYISGLRWQAQVMTCAYMMWLLPNTLFQKECHHLIKLKQSKTV